MFKSKIFGSMCVIVVLLANGTSYSAEAENYSGGIVLGHIYGDDGTTPVEGAVIKLRDTVTGAEFESDASDSRGIFRIVGIMSGIYLYSVFTPEGSFVADDVFGLTIKENETAKIALNMTAYSKKTNFEVEGILPEEEIEGETFIGRIVDFNANTKTAGIFIMQADLTKKDRIHALGERTNFYQKVGSIYIESLKVSKVRPGQIATVNLEHSAEIGDAVFVASKKNILPFLLYPIGVASVVAGSSAVAYNMGKEVNEECRPCSPFKIKH